MACNLSVTRLLTALCYNCHEMSTGRLAEEEFGCMPNFNAFQFTSIRLTRFTSGQWSFKGFQNWQITFNSPKTSSEPFDMNTKSCTE